jgi:hypothetical protein
VVDLKTLRAIHEIIMEPLSKTVYDVEGLLRVVIVAIPVI